MIFPGISGNRYEFEVYPWGTQFNPIGAVYLISRRVSKPDGGADHYRVYVGQTDDLSTRFDSHHKEDCFQRERANCICVHAEPNEQTRLSIETDLIAYRRPPCND